MKDKELRLNKLKEEIKVTEIIDTEDKILERYYDILHELAEKHGFEANTTDFDYERLYPKDYEKIIANNDNDEELYNNLVLASLEFNIEEIGENEDGEQLCRLIINMF